MSTTRRNRLLDSGSQELETAFIVAPIPEPETAAQAALFEDDPLVQLIRQGIAKPQAEKGETSTISASGEMKWRKCMEKNFSRRGEMSRLIYAALENYFRVSGAEVKEDGTIVSRNQANLSL